MKSCLGALDFNRYPSVRTLFCLLAVGSFPTLAACSRQYSPEDPAVVRLFYDTSRGSPIMILAFRGRQVIAQVAKHFEDDNRTMYVIDELQSDIFDRWAHMFYRFGNVSPPFLPDGPSFYRITITVSDSVVEQSYWMRDPYVRQWFQEAEQVIISDRNLRSQPPGWVLQSSELRRRMRLR